MPVKAKFSDSISERTAFVLPPACHAKYYFKNVVKPFGAIILRLNKL
jgi:hypothetical protein